MYTAQIPCADGKRGCVVGSKDLRPYTKDLSVYTSIIVDPDFHIFDINTLLELKHQEVPFSIIYNCSIICDRVGCDMRPANP
jgi:hypothetical protein